MRISIGTIAMSWKRRMPRISLPCGAWISPRSVSRRRRSAVEESVTSIPAKIARGIEAPIGSATRITATTAIVKTTWSGPATRNARPISFSRASENSRPIMKRRTATPISASVSTCSGSPISPSAPGPIKTPVSMKPTAEGSLRRRLETSTSSAAVSVMTRS
jgi:hypothetical protein